MSSYQSFPYQPGASDSLNKLVLLQLPSLAGKSFLDVGCNEGYFCGYALFEGARRVVGVDRDEAALRKARACFPGCEFRRQDWADLDPAERYDVILHASALHYADDQAALLARLEEMLTEDGVLVLEVGIAPGDTPRWVEVRRSIDVRLFPTLSMVHELLASHAWRYMGESCLQIGDPLPRAVFHIRRRRPYMFLLMQDPATGKTSLRRTCFGNFPSLSGDLILSRLAAGAAEGSEKLRELVKQTYRPEKMDVTVRLICDEGLLPDYLDIAVAEAGGRTAVFDGYLPRTHHRLAEAHFAARGHVPVTLSWDLGLPFRGQVSRARQEARKYHMYLAAVMSKVR